MQTLVNELRKQNAAQAEEITRLHQQLQALEQENALLRQQKQYLLHRMFGRKSEKVDTRQMELLLGLPVVEIAAESKVQPSPVSSRPRLRRERKPRIPEDLPTEDIVLEPDEVKQTPAAYRLIGEEITQELDMIPPKYFRRRYIRRKYVSKQQREVAPIMAALPPRLIAGGYAGPGVVTDVALKKYLEHIPLYRQEQMLRLQYGIEISRKTMCDWIDQAAWWLKPIYEHIAKDLRQSQYLQIDETPVRYCQAKGGGSSQGYLWVYHRPGGSVLYEWHTGRGMDCLEKMLNDFGGTMQTDGYGVYESYVKMRRRQIAEGANKPDIVAAACWAHVRRKFLEAVSECPGQAGWFLRQIQHLYRVEAQLRQCHASSTLREAVRSAQSGMILNRIENALRAKLSAHRPTSQMGKAIAYTMPLWPQLQVYLHDGRIEIDNNLVENAIRPTAVGKKNYLFFGHPEAGERSAILYTLLENCKREGINPREYLHDILSRRPSTPLDRIGELTPAAWAAVRKGKAA